MNATADTDLIELDLDSHHDAAGLGGTVAGRRQGRWTFLHAHGGLHRVADFVNGVLDGVYRTWFANGTAETAGAFRQGRPHGRWVEWHASGALACQAEYTDGVPSGIWKRWNAAGRLIERTCYRDGLAA